MDPHPTRSRPALAEHLAALVPDALSAFGVKGCAVAVVERTDGKSPALTLCKGYGSQDDPSGSCAPLPVDEYISTFDIGCLTDSFVTVALARLLESSGEEFDLPVQAWSPHSRLPVRSSTMTGLTLGQLASNSCGLPQHHPLRIAMLRRSVDEVVASLDRVPVVGHLPHTFPRRSDIGMLLLQKLAGHQYHGKGIECLVHEQVLSLLGLHHTTPSIKISRPDAKRGSIPALAIEKPLHAPEPETDAAGSAAGASTPAGFLRSPHFDSLSSTAMDMGQWLLFLINGGKLNDDAWLISSSILQQFWSPMRVIPRDEAIDFPEWKGAAVGLGWETCVYRGLDRVGIRSGRACMAIFPNEGCGVIVLSTSPSMMALALCNQVVDWIIDGDMSTPWIERLKDVQRAKLAKAATLEHYLEPQPILTPGASGSSLRLIRPLVDYIGFYQNTEFCHGVSVFLNPEGNLEFHWGPGLHGFLEHHVHDIFILSIPDDTDENRDWKWNELSQSRLLVTFVPGYSGAVQAMYVRWNDTVEETKYPRMSPAISRSRIGSFPNIVPQVLTGFQARRSVPHLSKLEEVAEAENRRATATTTPEAPAAVPSTAVHDSAFTVSAMAVHGATDSAATHPEVPGSNASKETLESRAVKSPSRPPPPPPQQQSARSLAATGITVDTAMPGSHRSSAAARPSTASTASQAEHIRNSANSSGQNASLSEAQVSDPCSRTSVEGVIHSVDATTREAESEGRRFSSPIRRLQETSKPSFASQPSSPLGNEVMDGPERTATPPRSATSPTRRPLPAVPADSTPRE
ncbi:beta-lactamase/transpeptidase-like protein [Polychytrium aggregatum]|uniref:beta-lactamase/transpeptidase-like protein n=1 Tax=Polychytrium aggregatum TaxID=110093 RepID=UPI0022FDC04A|nr:beta-lactamase/transpeptidase-like protein [Polychytrium aggregatum]KAI9199351.1 beta-lactamase/transpeptidase-like protein [Polychytrium aggregatum]